MRILLKSTECARTLVECRGGKTEGDGGARKNWRTVEPTAARPASLTSDAAATSFFNSRR